MFSKGGKLITGDEFDLRLVDKGLKRLNDYVNSKTSIYFECLRCFKTFKCKPKEINRINCDCFSNNPIIIKNCKTESVYKNQREKIKFNCLLCNNNFISTVKSIKSSKFGCPSCSGKKFSIDKIKSLLPNGIELLDDFYKGSNYCNNFKCLVCGNTWNTKSNYILHMGCGCPFCSKSKGEREIENYLKHNNINYISQYKVIIENKTYFYDFYLPDIDIYIEFDGIQHYQPIDYFGGLESFLKIKNSDRIKDSFGNVFRISFKDNVVELMRSIHKNKSIS